MLRNGRFLSVCSSSFSIPSRLYHPNRSSPGILQQYKDLVSQGVLHKDEEQQKMAVALQELLEQMKMHQKQMELYYAKLRDYNEKREHLRQRLLREEATTEAQQQLQKAREQNRSFIFKWFSRRSSTCKNVEPAAGRMVARIKREKKLDLLVGPRPILPPSPQGIYIFGSVGCGKTMLMDMFFKATIGVVTYSRRLHFHAAMLEIHDRMHKIWKERTEDTLDWNVSVISDTSFPPTLEDTVNNWLDAEEKFEKAWKSETMILDKVAESLLGYVEESGRGASLLCFDEVQVTDVFTAVALAGILSALIKKGTVLVATSNRAPNDLNKDGMQKEIFDKFLIQLQQHCLIMLIGTENDYRRVLSSKMTMSDHYFWPLNSLAETMFENKWKEFIKQTGGELVSITVPVMFGRSLTVPYSCNGAAYFSFEELCGQPLGAPDYVAVAQNFHTLFLSGIPAMSMRNRDKARRFITLVDELYNHHCRMICTAETSIEELFLGTEEGCLVDLESLQFETETENSRLRTNVLLPGSIAPLAESEDERARLQYLFSGREELFAFQRAISRLLEMQTPTYLQSVNFHTHQ